MGEGPSAMIVTVHLPGEQVVRRFTDIEEGANYVLSMGRWRLVLCVTVAYLGVLDDEVAS